MGTLDQLKNFQPSGSLGQVATQAAALQPALANKFTTTNQNATLVKTQQSVAKLSSALNEINTFVNDSGIAGGDQPFNIVTFAREFIQKQSEQSQSSTDKTTDSKPVSKKVGNILQKQGSAIAKTYLQSEKLISTLDKNVNKILKLSNVNYVKVENGQVQAQPIQNEEINKAVANIQKVINTYIKSVDKYARMVYNTDPITTTKQLRPGQNLSLYHIIKFIDNILAVYLLILDIKIKIRKARDLVTAANAAAQVPVPNLSLAAEYTERATQYTAMELNQLEDASATYNLISGSRVKMEFYGKKYEKSKSNLLNIKSKVDLFQTGLVNKSLTSVNNQITGSLNNLTGSFNNIAGSI